MQNCKTVYEPVVTCKNATDDKSLTNCSLFQKLVRALLYLAVTFRRDFALAKKYSLRRAKVHQCKTFLQQKENYDN